MDHTGIKQIRQRIDTTLENFKSIYGCYVNAGEVVAKFDISILDMTDEEKEMYSKLLKKCISGKADKNLLDIEMSDCEEQNLLYRLSSSRLNSSIDREILYSKIIDTLNVDINYCILLTPDTMDIKDSEESVSQFSYFLCGICPIKETKAELRYAPSKEEFRSNSTGSILSSPVLGFMYPGYIDGGADIYNALYYFGKEVHEELIEGVFAASAPPTADEQKEALHDTLVESLDEDYSLETTALIQSKLSQLKETEDEVTGEDIKDALLGTVDEDKLDVMVDELGTFHSNIDNIIEKKFQITTTETTITTDDPAGLRVQEIGGRKYILIPASGVKVNGREVTL